MLKGCDDISILKSFKRLNKYLVRHSYFKNILRTFSLFYHTTFDRKEEKKEWEIKNVGDGQKENKKRKCERYMK